MKNRICLLIVYFGKLPFWLPAFQLSCRYNPEVDWMIFIDDKIPPDPPENVKYFLSSWEAFNQIASQKLGFKVNISERFPYKICDYKPLLGKIYEEMIEDYDFWGHCDIDIIWGNIRKFVSDTLLKNYEMITSRPNRISGHFCLYKNHQRLNNLYSELPRFQKKLSDWQHYLGLDESDLTKYIKRINKNSRFNKAFMKLFRGKQKPALKIYWDEIWASAGWHQRMVNNDKKMFLKWRRGKAFHVDGTELMYLHFHKLKDALEKINFGYHDSPSQINITESAIISI